MSVVYSMAIFALVSSISPGPVNIVALSGGAQFGFKATQAHVAGATFGFSLLLLSIGFGLHEIIARWPGFTVTVQWAGIAFLGYMAFKLATSDGQLSTTPVSLHAAFWQGASMQWLNPKAWLASVAGMGIFASTGAAQAVWLFVLVYALVCYASIACWGYAGARLQRYLQQPAMLRVFNRSMAGLLVGSAAYLCLYSV